ncbi:alpha/beta hydrolase [Rhodothalassium salexigens]|uniref:alpha/beta fold hydrolase n=1 Tax=Rhodothalassium salexigens TaxID=1086 RepID=UPI0019121C6D|nr:alpha/beta hydrolase [Rhodothalassium salexigens]MBK5920084.1 alpha/beta hydrolase [Rhodothalassium salexigens]
MNPTPDLAAFVPPEAWRARGHMLSLGGHRLFVIDEAAPVDSPPVVLLHGYPTSSWDWHRIWPALLRHHRCVAPDLLGFGFSDKPQRHRYTIAEQADLVEALMDRLALPPVHLLAHDYGDTVAQELLARDNARPDAGRRLLSVSLLNGGLFPETHRARPIQHLLASPVGPVVARLASKARFMAGLAAVFGPETQPTADEIDAFWAIMSERRGQPVLARLIGYMAERRAHRARWVGALQDAHCPVQLINGSADPVSGAHMVARYAELVRDDDAIVALPGIGHYPQMEAPAAVIAAYSEFIDSTQ